MKKKAEYDYIRHVAWVGRWTGEGEDRRWIAVSEHERMPTVEKKLAKLDWIDVQQLRIRVVAADNRTGEVLYDCEELEAWAWAAENAERWVKATKANRTAAIMLARDTAKKK